MLKGKKKEKRKNLSLGEYLTGIKLVVMASQTPGRCSIHQAILLRCPEYSYFDKSQESCIHLFYAE